ncbi:hypothetical protein ACQKPX_02135 [Photobacterium sp. DNB23_23_1]|uniref:Xylose isomerase-like TIM barrel domain-containing protein n=1 Tax=Photobacterium pectinilyticum TaxID=2906793 RepID=A0ABT1N3D7_9GAMM|nr:hypothetical protein [Photobacterium sp. ZSDE20]MCQ1059057.1 hypothetical protein [Photobacterium sp. ZSDE20]MDD1824200.1 hypothetical protein [Photobacterium sp. ZSDE20]
MNTFCVSTASYSGYSLPEALASIERLGERNVEFVADQLLAHGELDVSADFVKEAFLTTDLHCHSVAITNETLDFSGHAEIQSLVTFSQHVGAKVLVLPVPANDVMPDLLANIQFVSEQFPNSIKILLENRGDQIECVVRGELEFERVVAMLEKKGVAFAYNPANLFSNQPGVDLLRHAYSLVKNADYLVAQDSVIKNRHYLPVPVGKGICRYDELFERFPSMIESRSISIRYPHRLYRNCHGEYGYRNVNMSIPELEKQLMQSISDIRMDISESKLRH